jgi:acetyl esterase/lipase
MDLRQWLKAKSKPSESCWYRNLDLSGGVSDAMGSIWPVADDVKFVPVDAGGVEGEWSSVPGSDASRVLLFFHGGGYCSGSIRSHRRMVSEAGRAAKVRTLAIVWPLSIIIQRR